MEFLTAKEAGDREKCPICRVIRTSFLKKAGNLVCMTCGCLFMPEKARIEAQTENRKRIAELHKEAQAKPFKCPKCEKRCKNKTGLVAHERNCGK